MAAGSQGMVRFDFIMRTFPAEAELIGRLVIGYGELEIALMNAVQTARGGDIDTVLKAMFRIRGEAQRIQIADALGRQVFAGAGLDAEFSKMICDLNYCRVIRNQYAHCIWHYDGTGRLGFVNIEEVARDTARVVDLTGLTTRYLDVPLLQEQNDYLAKVEGQIGWVNVTAQNRLLGVPAQLPVPLALPRPLRYKP